MLIAALESAFGTDNGLSQAPGFMESARFMQYMTARAEIVSVSRTLR